MHGKLVLFLCGMWVVTLVGWGAADSPWIYGIHWYGDQNSSDVEAMTGGKPVWVLETVNLYDGGWTMNDQAAKFQAVANKGHTVVIRLQPRWGWSIPAPAERAQYLNDVQAAAQQAANFCHTWQIGNEMNLYDEYGGGVLTATEYISFYKQVRDRIKAVSSPLGPQRVLVGPVSPGAYYQEVRHTDGLVYLEQMCQALAPQDTDGFALHAYGAPWFDAPTARADFQNGYVTQLNIIDDYDFCDKPAYILEWNRQTNPITDAWQEQQSALFLQGAFQDLNTWNNTPGNHPIVCAAWFIYPDFGGWEIFSIRKLRDYNARGANNDLWDAFQYACSLNYPAGSLSPDICGDSIVVDNDDGAPVYTTTGSWYTSGGTGYNGGTYQYSIVGGAHTATYTATLPESGVYDVSAIFVAASNRPTGAKCTITDLVGTQTVSIDQTQNSLTWVSLGNFSFNAGSASVTIDAATSTPTGKALIADAFKFRKVGELPNEYIVDNDDGAPAYTTTGTFTTSGGIGYDGGTYQYAFTGGSHTATWTANLVLSGTYDVSVIYVAGTNRPTSASYSVATASGTATATVNQTQNSLSWVSLGEYSFNAGAATVTLKAANSTPTGKAMIADAVRFVRTGDIGIPTATPTPSPTPSPSPSPSPTATPTVTPTPVPTPIPGNRVVNGNFESGFTNGLANGWSSWQGSWSNPITYGQTGYTKYEGSYAQYFGRNNLLRFHGGIFQRVTGLTPGASYRIRAKLRRYQGSTDQWMEFGYDLTGGTAPEAGSVQYTKLEGAGPNVWVTYDQTVTATGTTLSIFVKAGHYQENGTAPNYFYIDAVSVEVQ